MIKAHKLLINAQVRISDRENWTTGWLARNEDGDKTLPTHPDATCWCAMGAVAAEAGEVAASPSDLFGYSTDEDEIILGERSTTHSTPTGEFAKALNILNGATMRYYKRKANSLDEADRDWASRMEDMHESQTDLGFDMTDSPGRLNELYVWQVNDFGNHDDIVNIFDLAIKAAKVENFFDNFIVS